MNIISVIEVSVQLCEYNSIVFASLRFLLLNVVKIRGIRGCYVCETVAEEKRGSCRMAHSVTSNLILNKLLCVSVRQKLSVRIKT